MNDIAFVGIIVAFFVLAGLFVLACDSIIGSEEQALATRTPGDPERQAA